MGFSYRNVALGLVLIVLQACGAATPSSEIAIRLVRPSGSVAVLDTAAVANPTQVLSSEHCYFVHVTAASDTLTKLSVPETCTSSPRKVGLTTPETYNIGDMVKLMVPSGPQRRIDLVGVPKSRLQVTSCPKNLGFLANSQNPALSKFRVGAVDVALSELTLYASTVKDLGVGLEVVDLPYTNLAVGTAYFCRAAEDPETQAGFAIEASGGAQSLNLGNFVVGTSLPYQTITLRNTSTDVTVTGITGQNPYTSWSFKGGSYPGAGGTCATTLAPSSSCTLTVEYFPYSTGGRLAGVKNFPLQIAYTYNGQAQIATLPSQVNVTPGAMTRLCLLKGTETTDAFGQCPSGNIPAPSFSSRSYTVKSFDDGGNPVPAASDTELTIVSSDPFAASVNITLLAGTNSKTFTINHGRESEVLLNLSVSSVGGLNTYRPLLVTSVCAEAATHADFQSGQGLATDPFMICTPEQFLKIENPASNLSKHYKLASHVDLATRTELPLGSTSERFSGVLDGNGYEIRNPNRVAAEDYLGLFSSVLNATLRNLVVIDPNFNGTNYVGALAGVASGNSLLENNAVLFVQAGKTLGIPNVSFHVGGLVGKIEDSTVLRNNAVYLGTIATEARVSGGSIIGGLVGVAYGSSLIERSSVIGAGRIFASRSTGLGQLGGLVGATMSNAVQIRESKVDKLVMLNTNAPQGSVIGGLVGDHFGLIENAYFLGKLETSSAHVSDQVGGIAGSVQSGAVIRGVISKIGQLSVSLGNKGAITGYNNSTQVCHISNHGCLFSNGLVTTACGSGSACNIAISSASSFNAGNFNAVFSSDALTYDSNKWMFEASSGKFARQWERVAQLDPGFVDSTKSNISLSGLQGSFNASTGKGALRSNICKTSGQWYWEVTLLKGDWDEEFGIIAQTESNPSGELSFGRTLNGAWSLRDIAGRFVPYKGNYVDTTYGDPAFNSSYEIVSWNQTTTVRPNVGDVVGIYMDFASVPRKIRFFLNGVPLAQRGGNSEEHTIIGTTTGAYCAAVGKGLATSLETTFDMNFGTRAFKYPSNIQGFVKPYNFLE